jgi:hypothetical protein
MEPRGAPRARDITEAQAGTILNALILLGSGVAVAAEGALPGFAASAIIGSGRAAVSTQTSWSLRPLP